MRGGEVSASSEDWTLPFLRFAAGLIARRRLPLRPTKANPELCICWSPFTKRLSLFATPLSEQVMTTVGFAFAGSGPTIQQSMDASQSSFFRTDCLFRSRYSLITGSKVSFQCQRTGPATSQALSNPNSLCMALTQLSFRQS